MTSDAPDKFPFFSETVKVLEAMEIPYMLTGSMCCTAYGEPRSTNDIDIVINPTKEQLKALISFFQAIAYVSEDAAMEAYRRRSMFNVISNETVEKIDFIFRTDSSYAVQAFERRIVQNFGHVVAYSITPEDIVLSKLVWSRQTLPELQFRDIAGIVRMQSETLDREYLKYWGKELKVLRRMEEIFGEVENSNDSLG